MVGLIVRPDAETGSTTALATTTANVMENLVKSFNAMMKERAKEEFDFIVFNLKQMTEDGEECKWSGSFSLVFDFGYYYESEWVKFAWKKGKVETSVAIDYYRENRRKFITDRKMSNYVDKLIDEHGVDIRYFDYRKCKVSIYMDNPYYDEEVNMAEEIAESVECEWDRNAVENYVKLDWSLFREKCKHKILTDKDFAEMVYKRVCEENKYFSECRAYDDCFYVWLNKDIDSIRRECDGACNKLSDEWFEELLRL